ncbi:DUF397 domain-containing protein [Streptomyces sp. NPDC050844]|uniref:DUF397 domain-containing protein n=1 Tax=Streptomyces sp. NPDC050844 TaxID=3155790 RepID=UPI0033E1BBD5
MIQWQKSTYSGGADGNECVELAWANDKLLLRESNAPTQAISPAPASLTALLRRLKADRR